VEPEVLTLLKARLAIGMILSQFICLPKSELTRPDQKY
jgi:hypothetical protein